MTYLIPLEGFGRLFEGRLKHAMWLDLPFSPFLRIPILWLRAKMEKLSAKTKRLSTFVQAISNHPPFCKINSYNSLVT